MRHIPLAAAVAMSLPAILWQPRPARAATIDVPAAIVQPVEVSAPR